MGAAEDVLSEAAMGTDPENGGLEGSSYRGFPVAEWRCRREKLPRHLWLELFRCCDLG